MGSSGSKEKYRGYDPAHPDSPDHEFNWFDATTGGSEPYDDLEHGTHVTGTMVGSESGAKIRSVWRRVQSGLR